MKALRRFLIPLLLTMSIVGLSTSLATAATTSNATPIHVIPLTSGTKCADPHGAFGSEYYICAVVHGTGLTVNYVNATFDNTGSTSTGCGYFEVATTVGNFYGSAGCSSTAAGAFHSTITENVHYPTAGPLNVWWINTVGIHLCCPDGFAIS